jgi:crotonobetainyl-CoA:carnitine CoA-transferase CaiB-like acyl-CoA transferase
MQEAITSSLEQLWFQYNYDDVLPQPKIAPRQGSWHWARAYVVTPARTGWLMVTPTPAPPALLEWLIAEGVPGAAELVPAGQAFAAEHLTPLTELAMDFARRYDAVELFHAAQSRHLAWAEVQGVADLVANPQLAYRGALVEPPGLPGARRPRFPVVFTDTPAEVPGPPEPAAADEVLADWPAREAATPADVASGAKPLEGVRILDLTWVLAGPFCCRMLGDLGADVVKIQTAARATGVNDPNHGFYPTFNRSKRSVAMDMKAPGSLALMRRLVESADVLVENYAAGVLARWGLDWETLRSWNPRLVYVTMSGYGHEGPWSSMLSYGPTIHALSGLTSLSNPPGRGDVGVGYAMNDMAAGAMAACSILAALEAREHSGVGQFVDMAQLEVGAYLVGAALLDLTADGREAVPTGNVDPYGTHLLDAVVATADGELAVGVRDAEDADALRRVTGAGPDGLAAWASSRPAAEAASLLQANGVPAFRVCNADDLVADPHLGARGFFAAIDSPVFGERRFERFPAQWSESVLAPYRRAPAYVGEDLFEVFGELGFDDGDIAEAMADGRLA